MPIGLTASGEIVFPIQCRELIERQRGKAVEQNPAAAEEKPAAKQSEGVVPEVRNPVISPVETVPLPKKRVEHAPRERASRPDDGDCQHFKSYDPGSGTYTSYDGQRRSCRWAVQIDTRETREVQYFVMSPLSVPFAPAGPRLSDDGRGFR
jgi:BA14K-like protein